jgi:hypothetical protein
VRRLFVLLCILALATIAIAAHAASVNLNVENVHSFGCAGPVVPTGNGNGNSGSPPITTPTGCSSSTDLCGNPNNNTGNDHSCDTPGNGNG